MGLRAIGVRAPNDFSGSNCVAACVWQRSLYHPSELFLNFIESQCSRPKVQGTAYTHRTATNLARSVYHMRHSEKRSSARTQ